MVAPPVIENHGLVTPATEPPLEAHPGAAAGSGHFSASPHQIECAGGCSPAHARIRKVLTSIVMLLLLTLTVLAGYCTWGWIHG